MSSARERFTKLLGELFQFDSADLDFGIYRIINHKRRVIERWIKEDLPKAIQEEFKQGALAEQVQAQQVLEEARRKVVEALGEDALDAEGNLAEPYRNTKVGKEYLEAQAKATHTQSTEALESAIYNHLYTFFSRYWQDGDFISKRRYSKKERYAIPYNGEEVTLYWANHDQYYIKTAEHFTDYTWRAPNGVTVHFRLKAADVEQNNVKGEKRFFLPRPDKIGWESKTKTLTIPFEYRPLTGQEEKKYGNQKQQEKILEEALQALPGKLRNNTEALAALTAERRKDAKGNPVSYLAHHLRHYAARNTRDFFIHKDLKGFLSRELDFYLKNEVLNLDELEAAGENLAEGWFQLMRLIKRVGNHIIDFLAQIEDFQRALWEKKKFVTETFYCITVGNIPEDFYPEIASNEVQWKEWETLFHIRGLPNDQSSNDPKTREGRLAFLKANPTLVLDTRHFPQDFTDRLLASFENLDEMTDGLLIHSENWQALNLLQEKHRERVKCTYIDPPYNTGEDDFLYKDGYQESSWASMLKDRAILARNLCSADGLFFLQIGDEENALARLLLDTVFPERKNTVVVRRGIKNVQAQFSDIARLSLGHDVIHIYTPKNRTRLPHLLQMHDDVKPGKWDTFWRGTDRPSMRYELFGQKPETGQWRWEKNRAKRAVSNYEYYLQQEADRKTLDEWYVENLQAGVKLDFVRLNEEGVVQYYVPPQGYRLISDNWLDISTAGSFIDFQTEKNIELLIRIISWNTLGDDWILDYFAGSGTTAHAVINLNREDGGQRRFILVEMGEYFDTVLLPRIKKVTFAPEWKDGKPRRLPKEEEAECSPRIVKVLRLESYEDALNNITFDEESGQQAMGLFGEEYLLRYMLRWEAKKSETLLDVEKLDAPFAYKLHIHRDGETRIQPVDLPETFNYLIGLDVETRRGCLSPHRRESQGDGRYLVYRGVTRDGRKVAVIWRETKGWSEEDYKRDAAFVKAQRVAEDVDEIFVNGDSVIPGARSLDGIFKARMFAGAEG